MRKFELSREQIDFLKKEYADNPLVQKVLTSENNRRFEIDVDTKIAFMDYIEDESVYWIENTDVRVYKRRYILSNELGGALWIILKSFTRYFLHWKNQWIWKNVTWIALVRRR